MSQYESLTSRFRARLNNRPTKSWLLWAAAILVPLVVIGSITSPVVNGESAKHGRVSGAGKTIIEGGTGGTSLLPVTTLVAFHADAQGGAFECLAFAPSHETGAGSAEFDVNVMYVTGKVTSLEIRKEAAILHGTATVTGLGAGQGLPFIASVHTGGPGTTIKLDISGLTFPEILIEGRISID